MRTVVKTIAVLFWNSNSDFSLIMNYFMALDSNCYEECFSVCRASWSLGWITLLLFFSLNNKTWIISNQLTTINHPLLHFYVMLLHIRETFFSFSCVSWKVTVRLGASNLSVLMVIFMHLACQGFFPAVLMCFVQNSFNFNSIIYIIL